MMKFLQAALLAFSLMAAGGLLALSAQPLKPQLTATGRASFNTSPRHHHKSKKKSQKKKKEPKSGRVESLPKQ
jgi:hypothetical protein